MACRQPSVLRDLSHAWLGPGVVLTERKPVSVLVSQARASTSSSSRDKTLIEGQHKVGALLELRKTYRHAETQGQGCRACGGQQCLIPTFWGGGVLKGYNWVPKNVVMS